VEIPRRQGGKQLVVFVFVSLSPEFYNRILSMLHRDIFEHGLLLKAPLRLRLIILPFLFILVRVPSQPSAHTGQFSRAGSIKFYIYDSLMT
jgi:hypothetical protein